ncbi:hypothetical protein PybrP1_000247 [[Pythium] brassicae (nom. inval.)]|nr:hypothetical protein PybrP1_000247 [[Pythium] brassicae (nom. inval.)]
MTSLAPPPPLEEEVTTAEFELEIGGEHASGSASLFESAAEGDVARLCRLLDQRLARVDDVDVDGFSALMIAAAEGHRAVVLELLARGADVAVRTLELRSSALHFAAKNSDAEIVRAICEKDPRYVDCLNINADTPLIWACIEGRAECVRVLLAHDANANAVNQFGATTLICAVMIGEDPDEDENDDARAEIITLLLATNPKLVNVQDREGSTAMHLAAACGYLQCVKTLLAHGADITLRNAIGQTPLEEAEQTGLDESDVCVEHLRAIWHQLEEEAAARMLSMLEMEEASAARSSRAPSGAAVTGGGGSGKKSKKKNKKLKRRAAAKQQALGTGDAGAPVAADTPGSAAAAGGASGPGSSGESSDDDDAVADRDGLDARVLQTTAGAGHASATSDVVELSNDTSAVAGAWTTVGRKAPKPPASASSTQADEVVSLSLSQSRANAPNDSAVPSFQHLAGAAYSSGKNRGAKAPSPSQKVAPIRRKMLQQPRQEGDAHAAAANESAESATVAPHAVPLTQPATANGASHAIVAPLTASSREPGSSRIGATHPVVPYSSTPIFNRSSASSSLSSLSSSLSPFASPFSGRAHERVRTHFSFPSSWRAASSSVGAAVASSSAAASRSLGWKHAHRNQRAAAEATSKWVARLHLADARVAAAVACLGCGICGELAQDNLQCNVSVNGSGCAQLYCSACVRKAVGGVAERAGGLSLQCAKCHQLMTKDEMRTNHFAQAQAASLLPSSGSGGGSSSGGALFAADSLPDAPVGTIEEMRHTLETALPTAATVDLSPFFLSPGSDLTPLSNGQLEILEHAHQLALAQIMDTRLANARAQERMQVEEWMKTQRDILHYASMVAGSAAAPTQP